MVLASVTCIGEDMRSEQPETKHHVHGGDKTQVYCPHHQEVARHKFTVSRKPVDHPTCRTDTKHQEPAGNTGNQRETESTSENLM